MRKNTAFNGFIKIKSALTNEYLNTLNVLIIYVIFN